MENVLIADLNIGDIIAIRGEMDGFVASTVVAVTPSYVETVRPYVHINDFTMGTKLNGEAGSKAIDYLGTERMTLWRNDVRPVAMLQRFTGRLK